MKNTQIKVIQQPKLLIFYYKNEEIYTSFGYKCTSLINLLSWHKNIVSKII